MAVLQHRPWEQRRAAPPKAGVWLGAALGAALVLAVAVLITAGVGEYGTTLALKATARLAFAFFWPAYAGGSLAALLGRRPDRFTQHGRVFGLAFAAVLTVHLALVTWLSLIGHAPSLRTFAIFGLGVVWAAGLALFSLRPLAKALGPLGWRLLRYVGMNYLLFDFALDFFRPPLSRSVSSLIAYAPFQALVVAAVALRLIALARSAANRLLERD
jgi:hypothetical protein